MLSFLSIWDALTFSVSTLMFLAHPAPKAGAQELIVFKVLDYRFYGVGIRGVITLIECCGN